MDVGQLFGLVAGGFFLVLGLSAAWAVMRALSDDDAAGLSGRVFRALTATTFLIGFPLLVGVLWFLNADAAAHGGDSGIMSRGMGLTVLFVFGGLGLIGTWLSAITLGFVGAVVVRHLRPLPGALVMLAIVSGAPVLFAVTALVEAKLGHR